MNSPQNGLMFSGEEAATVRIIVTHLAIAAIAIVFITIGWLIPSCFKCVDIHDTEERDEEATSQPRTSSQSPMAYPPSSKPDSGQFLWLTSASTIAAWAGLGLVAQFGLILNGTVDSQFTQIQAYGCILHGVYTIGVIPLTCQLLETQKNCLQSFMIGAQALFSVSNIFVFAMGGNELFFMFGSLANVFYILICLTGARISS